MSPRCVHVSAHMSGPGVRGCNYPWGSGCLHSHGLVICIELSVSTGCESVLEPGPG